MQIVNYLNHTFVHPSLYDAKVAIDCGANHGEFAAWLSQHTSAQVYSFEPDPRLFPKLPSLPRVQYFPTAVDGESGECQFALGAQHCSSSVYRESDAQQLVTVPKISLADFCRQRAITKIDFLKMDIEGAELNVFEQANDELLTTITQITVEFHDFLNKDDIPRIERIVARLRKLGFFGVRLSHYTWGDCLFINQNQIRLNPFQKCKLIVMGKYAPGIRRRLSQFFNSATEAARAKSNSA